MATDRELLQMALDALELTGVEYLTQKEIEHLDALEIALRARLAQPEQKPVAWRKKWEGDEDYTYYWMCRYKDSEPLYTAPPQREWVGLTDEEIEISFIQNDCCDDLLVFENVARAIEAKLKEKNG